MTDAPDRPKHPGGRPTKYDPAYCDQLVEFMAQGYSLAAFAGGIGVCKATLNVWAAEHPEFLDALSRGKCKRALQWERMGIEIAKGNGGPGASTMVIFGLKNVGEGEWRDKQEVEHAGKDGGPMQVASMSADEFERVARKIAGEV